jgi:hypothetical protein
VSPANPVQREEMNMLDSMRGRVRRVSAAACLAGAATAALVVSAPASAGDSGACAGSLIESRPANWLGKKVGELDVYYNAATGKNCAKMNHAGSTWGKSVRTAVQVSVCQERRPGNGCHPIPGFPDAEDIGVYSYYAGPATTKQSASGHCIVVSGYVYLPGKGYGVGVSTGISHCG